MINNIVRNVVTSTIVKSLVPFYPNRASGLIAWYRYGQGITITGSGVSQWDDVSGNDNHLVQVTDANRPAKQDDGSILFDGISHFLITAGFTLNQPETVYFLGKTVTETGSDRLFDGSALNTGGVFDATSNQIAIYAGAQLNCEGSAWPVNIYHALSVVYNGASSVIQIDTPVQTTNGNAGANNMGGFTLGAYGGGGGSFGNIQVKEIAIYNEAHDANTRKNMCDYLKSLT